MKALKRSYCTHGFTLIYAGIVYIILISLQQWRAAYLRSRIAGDLTQSFTHPSALIPPPPNSLNDPRVKCAASLSQRGISSLQHTPHAIASTPQHTTLPHTYSVIIKSGLSRACCASAFARHRIRAPSAYVHRARWNATLHSAAHYTKLPHIGWTVCCCCWWTPLL